jgi:hypothetical protein
MQGDGRVRAVADFGGHGAQVKDYTIPPLRHVVTNAVAHMVAITVPTSLNRMLPPAVTKVHLPHTSGCAAARMIQCFDARSRSRGR